MRAEGRARATCPMLATGAESSRWGDGAGRPLSLSLSRSAGEGPGGGAVRSAGDEADADAGVAELGDAEVVGVVAPGARGHPAALLILAAARAAEVGGGASQLAGRA